MALADEISEGAKRAKADAGEAMSGLAGIADGLDMRETATRLRDTEKQLGSDTFNLIVMGRFKNGKSTLLNALLGGTTTAVELSGQKGPMVVDNLPATATLTAVRYAEEPYVTAWMFDGKPDPWPMSRYLRESTLDIDDEQNMRRFGQIREFEMGYPARLCQAGVTVFDSPGLDDHPSRTAVTRDATRRCDAAIVVYRSDAPLGQNELEYVTKVVAEGTRVFTVVNLFHSAAVTDRLRGFVWNRYVRDYQGGPTWNNQNLAERDIYFVDALKARDARYSATTEQADASGLAQFEDRLAGFLLRDRQQVHLAKFTQQAASLAGSIDKQIGQRRLAVQADQQKLRAAYTAALPKLATIRERPAKIPKIIDRYRAEAELVLQAGFRQAVNGIRKQLPEHLADTSLPSGEKLFKVFHEKKLRKEAAEVISSFVTSKLDHWSEVDAVKELEPILERLGAEIAGEVAAIDREFEAVNFGLTGWRVPARDAGSVVGTGERVVSAIAGFLAGDIVGAFTGGAGGLRGAAGSFAGGFGTAFLLGSLGVVAAPVLIPAAMAGALLFGAIAGGAGFENRVKKKASDQADGMLRDLAGEAEPKISAKLSTMFAEVEEIAVREINAVIADEERNLQRIVELNERDQAEREQILASLETRAIEVTKYRDTLRQAVTIAKQA